MDKEISDQNCLSDSSDGLPDLGDLFQNYSFDIGELKKNDIVWAEYKDLHWPALVRKVDKKNKKVNVWYADSPGKCFKLPFKKIRDFCDIEFRRLVQTKAESHPLAKKHSSIFARALLFKERKDCDVDPVDFFDMSKPYFLFSPYSLGSSESKSTIDNISTEKNVDKNASMEESLKAESLTESDVENSSSAKYLLELHEEDSLYNDEMVDTILSCIKTGQVDQYLLDIVNSKITSEKHELFVKAVQAGKKELLWNSPPYIPIKNEKLHSVSVYLNNLYEKMVQNKKHGVNEYIILVWLPEAVDKAVLLIKKSLKSSVDSGSNVSSSNLGTEASKLSFSSGIKRVSNSSISVESSESVFDPESSNASNSSFQVKASELPTNSINSDAFSPLKRKLDFVSCLVKSNNSDVLDTEACTLNKKKFLS